MALEVGGDGDGWGGGWPVVGEVRMAAVRRRRVAGDGSSCVSYVLDFVPSSLHVLSPSTHKTDGKVLIIAGGIRRGPCFP